MKHIINLLEAERSALLTGDLGALSRIAPLKERALAKIDLSPDDFNKINQMVSRNQSMLVAAADGIKRAREILSQNRSTVELFQTYGPNGESAMINAPKVKALEKRK